jgi:hypothetical protein
MPSKAQFIVDKITNSIEERLTGKSFETTVIPVDAEEIKKILKKTGDFLTGKRSSRKKAAS